MGVLLTILFFLMIFSYVFAKILPYLLKWVIERKLKKMSGNGSYTYTNYSGSADSQQDYQKEGEVKVKTDFSSKKVSENIGEYVDFEDVK